jgi:hypothetical protein
MEQPEQIPVSTRVNTRSSLACLQCRSKHIKCDGKQPHCSKCIALGKQCQYTASRRGGLDRATLSERRKRLARGNEARADHATQLSSKTSEGVGFTNSRAQSVITLDSVDWGFSRDFSDQTPSLITVDNSQASTENLAEDPLINSYYSNFHHLHPFAPPLRHFIRLCQIPQEGSLHFKSLAAVMRLIGNLYTTHEWSLPLQTEAETRISQLHSSNPVQVQCRLLYSIALFWNNFRAEADREMEAAKDMALTLGMHTRKFAAVNGFGDEVLMESWRRTWWMMYTVDAYYAGTLGTLNLKVFHIEASVDLPCEESEYESGVSYSFTGSFSRLIGSEGHSYTTHNRRLQLPRVLRRGGNLLIVHLPYRCRKMRSICNFHISQERHKARLGAYYSVRRFDHRRLALITTQRPEANYEE